MNTIHSSSLAAYPAGYIKPERDSFAQNQAPTKNSTLQANGLERRPETPASTPDQIKTALAEMRTDQSGSALQNQDNRTHKALQAYNETSEQLNQIKLENLISRVDYYA